MGLVQRGGVATVHNLLTGRGDPDSHPISAVTGLTAGLTALGTAAGITINDANEHFTAENVENALDELFTNVSNGKIGLVTDITVKGGTVSPIGDVPTFSEIGAGITSIPQLDTTDATATAPDLLATKTAYINGSKVTGSMTNRGAVNITPGTSAQTIEAGYHNGSGVVAGDADLISSNIKDDVVIFGVTGTYSGTGYDTSDATMIASELLSGKTGYNSTGKITGTYVPKEIYTTDITIPSSNYPAFSVTTCPFQPTNCIVYGKVVTQSTVTECHYMRYIGGAGEYRQDNNGTGSWTPTFTANGFTATCEGYGNGYGNGYGVICWK